jgi:hypothetical protein
MPSKHDDHVLCTICKLFEVFNETMQFVKHIVFRYRCDTK